MSSPTVSTTVEGLYPSLRTAWGYFQREMIHITWTVSEVALLTPFALSLMQWARYWPPGQVTLWLLLIMLLSFNLVRLMSLLWLPKETQRTLMLAAMLLVVILTLPSLLYTPRSLLDFSWLSSFYSNVADSGNQLWTRDASVFMLTLFVWWRGIRLANQSFSINRAGLRLRLGGLLLAPLIIWAGRRLAWEVTPYVLLFFLAAISSVALVRAEQLEKDRSGQSVSLNPRWLAVVAAASLLTILTSALLTALISGNTAVAIAGWLSPLWVALALALATVARTVVFLTQPLFLLLGLIMEWFISLLSGFLAGALAGGLEMPLGELPTPVATTEITEVVNSGADGEKMITILLMVALVLAVALTLGRLYRHSSVAARLDDLDDTESIQAVSGQASLRQRLLDRLGFLRNWRTAASIRRIYHEMCQAADASGYPRTQSETPFEYLITLAEVWPGNTDDSRLITEAYVKVRYGEFPETKQELDAILTAWESLEITKPVSLDEPYIEQRA